MPWIDSERRIYTGRSQRRLLAAAGRAAMAIAETRRDGRLAEQGPVSLFG
jgi:hypothetical protein